MVTKSTQSSDGVKIVYDVSGDGEPLLLLHGGGGGQTRKDWHDQGYVKRLQTKFEVITMDIRGHGESDKPTDSSAYTIDQMCDDVLAVADAHKIDQFSLWGYSFGGNIGRFLARRSNRVKKLIVIGIPMGLAVQGEFLTFTKSFSSEWQPIVDKINQDPEALNSISTEQKSLYETHNIPVLLAWLQAMLDWGGVDPTELPCPSLWVSGSENQGTMQSIEHYKSQLQEANMQVKIFEGLDHQQEFEKIDLVFPKLVEFMA